MNNPYVSIVVPFLNADRTLSKCIQSILGQTREDWELILVDDGSTDESAAICQTYSESDKRVKLLRRPHEGVGPARNAAIKIAQGEKLCFVDADDTVEPDYLEGLCSHPEVDLVVCGYFVDRYDEDGNLVSSESHCPKELTIRSEQEKYLLEEVFMSGIMHINCNKLFNMSIIKKHDIRYKYYPVNEDFIFILEYLLKTHSISFIGSATYHWIRIEGNNTAAGSIPDNIVQIYEYSHSLLSKYLNDAKADIIAYRSYDLIIYKCFYLYTNKTISRKKCFDTIISLHQSENVKKSFLAYKPLSIVDKLYHFLNYKGYFQVSLLLHRIVSYLHK